VITARPPNRRRASLLGSLLRNPSVHRTGSRALTTPPTPRAAWSRSRHVRPSVVALLVTVPCERLQRDIAARRLARQSFARRRRALR